MVKKTDGSKLKETKHRSRAKLHPVLAYLGSAGEPVKLADDSGLQDTEIGGVEAVDIMVFRTEPREYSGPPHQYLETFDTPPSLKLLRDRFGGGKYLIRIYKDGRYQKGAATVVVAGSPKPVEVATDVKEISPGVIGTGDRVSDIVLATVERMRSDVISAITASGSGEKSKVTGLDAGSLSELIDVANRKMVENRVLSSLLPTPEATAAPQSSNISDLLKLGLEIFRAGAEYGPKEADGSGGMMALLQPLLQKLLTPAPQLKPTAHGPLPTQNPLSGAGVGPVDVEGQRRAVEAQSIEARRVVMINKFKDAVRLMLMCLEAETEYTNEVICSFIKRKMTDAEIAAIGGKLTFGSIYALMEDDPEEQVVLDEHKDRVEQILVLLSGGEPIDV